MNIETATISQLKEFAFDILREKERLQLMQNQTLEMLAKREKEAQEAKETPVVPIEG